VDIDILAALEASPSRGAGRCHVGAFLDSIPADTEHRDELIRLVETPYDSQSEVETRSGQNMAKVLTTLGLSITQNPVLDHRSHSCRCYR
jgi:hypothetical protein